MNKVINNKRYDTETAEMLLQGKYDDWQGDYEAFLHRKRTGEYFLFLKDIVIHKNGVKGGADRILPLTVSEAKKWAEKTVNTADEYESIFRAASEEKSDLHLTLTEKELQKLREYALERKISVSEVISKFIKSL